MLRFLALGVLMLVACNAQTVQGRHAQVELLAEPGAVATGRQLWLGIHFTMEKGWHIYWQNPGDSGQPPVLQWKLPAGFSVGELQWPHPEKLQNSTLMDYGYKDEVLLLAPIQAPPFVHDRPELMVDAKWLICREVCIPEKAQLHLALPVKAAPADERNAQLFAAARKLVPQPWPKKWKANAVSQKDNFAVSLVMGEKLQHADFFPLEPQQIENAAPQVLRPTAQGATIMLRKSDQLLKPVTVLHGVLVMSATGESYRLEIPVTQQ